MEPAKGQNGIFQAIADPTRRRMLALLAERERPVTDLVGYFNLRQPSISEHLRVLRDAGLVEARQVGRQRIYRLEPMRLRDVADWVAVFERFWEDRLDSLGRYLAEGEDPTGSPSRRQPGSDISMEID